MGQPRLYRRFRAHLADPSAVHSLRERYARYLKWLTLVLLAYVAVVCVVKVDWQAAALGLFVPRFPLTSDSLTVVVAIFGTTISPYLMFWQSSQEVEEIMVSPFRNRIWDLFAKEATGMDGADVVLALRQAGEEIWAVGIDDIY